MTRYAIPATAFDANVVAGPGRTRLDEDTHLVRDSLDRISLMQRRPNPRYDPSYPEDGYQRYIEQVLVQYRPNGDIAIWPPRYGPRHPSLTRGAYGRILCVLPPGWSMERTPRNLGYGGAVRLMFREAYVLPFGNRSGEVVFHANCDVTGSSYRVPYTTLCREAAQTAGVTVPERTRPLHPGFGFGEPVPERRARPLRFAEFHEAPEPSPALAFEYEEVVGEFTEVASPVTRGITYAIRRRPAPLALEA